MADHPKISPLSIAGGYFILAGLWILVSDRAVELVIESPEVLGYIQSVKGLFFVAVTGLLLYFFVNRLTKQTEHREKLKRNREQEFEKLFRNNPNPMYLFDRNTFEFIEVNRAAVEKYGYNREEFLSMSITDIRPEDEVEALMEDIKYSSNSFHESRGWTHITKEGEHLSVKITVHPTEYEGREARLVMITDLTEQEQALEEVKSTIIELEKTYNQLHHHISNTPLGVVEWDDQFRVTFWSDRAEEIFGWKAEEVRGLSPEEWNFVHEEDREHVNHVIQSLLSGQENGRQLVNRNYHKNGSIVHCNWFNSLVRDLEGGRHSILSLANDITDYHLAEQEKAYHQKRFEVAAGLTSDVIWELDIHNDILWFSDTMQYVFARPELTGTVSLEQWEHCVAEEDRQRVGDSLRRFLDHHSEGVWEETYRFIKGNGESAYVIDRGQIYHDEHNETTRMVGAMIDITEQRRYETQLQEWNKQLEAEVRQRTRKLETVNQELEAFTYSVSHDLRAPLRSIEGFSSALRDHLRNQIDDEATTYLNRVIGASQRMSELIEDLLKLSRISRQEVTYQAVGLKTIADELMKKLRQEHPERNVRLYCDDDITLRGDARLIRVMMENLIGNAWKFTQKCDPAEIHIRSTSAEEGGMLISIEDNGSGFNPVYTDKLFRPFQRLHSQNEFEGSGIGLATVKRIVNKHDGTISATGSKDNGAIFTIYWPHV